MRKIVLIMAIIFFANSAMSVNADTFLEESNSVVNKNIISPLADVIEWRFKMIDGVLHKRQYNYSRGLWIGTWTKV